MNQNIQNKTNKFCQIVNVKSVLYKQRNSHTGTLKFYELIIKCFTVRILVIIFCVGILYAIGTMPNIKRKIEMENFEGKVNYHLLHTYAYVSYLDTVKELNEIELSDQKNLHLQKLCDHKSFSDILCLNLIMHPDGLFNS